MDLILLFLYLLLNIQQFLYRLNATYYILHSIQLCIINQRKIYCLAELKVISKNSNEIELVFPSMVLKKLPTMYMNIFNLIIKFLFADVENVWKKQWKIVEYEKKITSKIIKNCLLTF